MIRFRASALACAALAFALGAWAAPAADPMADLRREKARLVEMRRKAEKAAAELSETIRKERKTRARVGELKGRLDRQRSYIAGIDRKLAALSSEMERAEAEVRELAARQERSRRSLGEGARVAFRASREPMAGIREGTPGDELRREFAERLLAQGRRRFESAASDRERKEAQLSGIERRIETSEKQIERERKVGEKLLSRQEAESARLAEIGEQKRKKKAELAELRARIARMDSLVGRITREARAREREAAEKEAGEAGKPGAGERKRDARPKRFAGLPGGLYPPLSGKVVGRFGRQHDPVFDVDVENRGVEIEAASGAAIKAVGKGEVVFVGAVPGFGRVLILQHGSGLFSVYGKAGSFSARQGRTVSAGDEIGRLPSDPSGKSVLYLEFRAGGTAIDPLSAISIP